MRLIDADALKKEIHRYVLDVYCINLENSKEFAGYSTGENYCEGLYEATELIDNLPTIDAAPVVYGYWITTEYDSVKCSICGSNEDVWWADTGTNFCPNCGADMRGAV